MPADQDEETGPDICVIRNAGSGKRDAAEIENELRHAFDRHPGRFHLRTVGPNEDIGAAVDEAVKAGFRVIAAAGGDGTIVTVAGRLVGTDRPLGILPLGTFNFFARGLGMPEELDEAVDLLARGEARRVTIGEVNGKIFLNNASIGIYPAILQQREGTYRRWGRSRLAAHWSVVLTFLRFHRPLSLKVTVDGQPYRMRTPLAFVARSAYQLEQYGLDGCECIRDGRFALFLVPNSSRLDLLWMSLRLLWGTMRPGRDFELICGEDIVIETKRRRRLVARDGERERMASPFQFRILKDALAVVALEQR